MLAAQNVKRAIYSKMAYFSLICELFFAPKKLSATLDKMVFFCYIVPFPES